MKEDILTTRSALFVPADQPKLIEKAEKTTAQAICLDLEDAVRPENKSQAREQLLIATAQLKQAGKQVFVRVNSELELFGLDIQALPTDCDAIILPKTRGWLHLYMVGEVLDRLSEAGACHVACISMVEDPQTLLQMAHGFGACHPRIVALTLGTEDLSHGLHCQPDSPLIADSFCQLAHIASGAGLALWGFPGSIAEFRDLEKYRNSVERGKQFGATGALCIHPAQLDVLHQVFVPSVEETDWAQRVISAFEQAEMGGKAVVAVDGKMVDKPVYLRAQAIVKAAEGSDSDVGLQSEVSS